jgi:hypothetical protein
MTTRTLWTLALAAAVAAAIAAPAFAGPCTSQIDKAQADFDRRLDAEAAEGASGPESVDATLHHQPTPQTIAEAEAKLGDISPDLAQSFIDALHRARDADDAGKAAECRQAVADARAILNKKSGE